MVTAEEVRKNFVIEDVEEATKTLVETVSESLDYDASVELLEAAISTVSQEEADASSMLDKLAWIARECYLMGFINAFQVSAEAAKQGWESLFQSPPQES